MTTYIQGRSQSSYNARVIASSAIGGSNCGSSGFCRHCIKKQTQNKYVHDLLLIAYLHAQSYCSRCRWHIHRTKHGYFDYRENPKTPTWTPCRDKNGAGSGISFVYLWSWQKVPEFLSYSNYTELCEFKNCTSMWRQNNLKHAVASFLTPDETKYNSCNHQISKSTSESDSLGLNASDKVGDTAPAPSSISLSSWECFSNFFFLLSSSSFCLFSSLFCSSSSSFCFSFSSSSSFCWSSFLHWSKTKKMTNGVYWYR